MPIPEPVLLVHLHNMLVKKGYITEPVGLYATLEELFTEAFYVDGQAPTSDVFEALTNRIRRTPRWRRPGHISTNDLTQLKGNEFFKANSVLMLSGTVDLDTDRVPDVDIPMPFILDTIRIYNLHNLFLCTARSCHPFELF